MRTTSKLSKFSVIYLFLLFTPIVSNAQDNIAWINFSWKSGVSNGKLLEKSAMIIPMRINDIPYAFDAQFDLGAVSTMIYGNTFAPYLAQDPALQKQINSDKTVMIEGKTYPYFEGISIYLDKVEFPNQSVALFKDFGDVMTADSIDTPTTKHIGTVAADFFNTKILVIDYVNQRLCSIEELPAEWTENIDLVDIEYIEGNNWIILPLQVGDNVHKVVFDTGSSLFPLVSSASKIAQISDVSKFADSMIVSSWGVEETVYGYTPEVNISLGGNKFAPLPVYTSQGLDDETLDAAGFWGIVGNRYFLNNVIVIDYKNKKFGILNNLPLRNKAVCSYTPDFAPFCI